MDTCPQPGLGDSLAVSCVPQQVNAKLALEQSTLCEVGTYLKDMTVNQEGMRGHRQVFKPCAGLSHRWPPSISATAWGLKLRE